MRKPRTLRSCGIKIEPKWDWSDWYKSEVKRSDRDLRRQRIGGDADSEYRHWLYKRNAYAQKVTP